MNLHLYVSHTTVNTIFNSLFAVVIFLGTMHLTACSGGDDRGEISNEKAVVPLPNVISAAGLSELNNLLVVEVVLTLEGKSEEEILPLQITNNVEVDNEVRGTLPRISVGVYNVALRYFYNDNEFGRTKLLELAGKQVSITENGNEVVDFSQIPPEYVDSDNDGHANIKELTSANRSDPSKTFSVPGRGFLVPEHPKLEISTQAGSFKLHWDAIQTALDYDVLMFQRNNGTDMTHLPIVVPMSEFGHADINEGIQWDFMVRARPADNDYGEFSSPTFVQMTKHDPLVPSKISITAGEGQNSLSWEPVDGAESYVIYYSTSLPITKTIRGGIVASELTSREITHRNLKNGQMYYYVITALISSNNVLVESSESSVVGATPYGQLSAPANLKITTELQSQIDLAWSEVPGAVSYNLYMSSVAGLEKETVRNKFEQGSVDASMIHPTTNAFFPHPGLLENTRYYFAVTAIDKYGRESKLSEEVFGETHVSPSMPTQQ